MSEYEDPMGLGSHLKLYYEEAEQAFYDRDYESASRMYWSLGVLNITADDVYGGEPAELGIEEMGSENLVSLNLKQIAILGAALGEIEESMGKARGKAERVSKYLAEFPRHRAFKQEMKAYM